MNPIQKRAFSALFQRATAVNCTALHRFNKRHLSDSKELYYLSAEQKQSLETNGFLHIPQFVPPSVALNVRQRIMQLLTEFDASSTKSVFATHRTSAQYKDTYFVDSGDKIRYFWEENVFDDDGQLNRPKELAINKIGHALHTLDPFIHSYVWGYLAQLTFDVGMISPIALQSMYICKQPGVGGEVGEHQDSTFLYTQPLSCHGFWLAVDDTSTTNGCIYAKPGSHIDDRIGLRNRFHRINNDETTMVPIIGDGSLPRDGGVAVPAKRGDLVILHGSVVHWSDANTSDIPRHALMMHCVDGNNDYPTDNWLQYPNGVQSMPRFTHNDVANQIKVRQMINDASF